VYKLQRERGRFLVLLSKEIRRLKLGNLNLDQLFAEYQKIENAWVDFDHVNMPTWLIGGEYFQIKLKNKLGMLGISEEEIYTLLTPNELSFSAKEELGILKIALKLKSDLRSNKKWILSGDARRGMAALVKKYHWIPFGYDGPDLYDTKYYEKAVREMVEKMNSREIKQKIEKIDSYSSKIKERQGKIFAKYHLSKELRRQIKIIQTLAKMTDERKEYTFQSHIAFQGVIEHIARILGHDCLVLKHLILDEIRQYQNDPKKIIKLGEERMKSPVMFYRHDGKLDIITGPRAKKMFKEMIGEDVASDGLILKGSVGSKGSVPIVRGIVRILSTPQEMNKLKDGEILVTAMTTPEYVPAMRRSLAIITDEGGVTCHAAIVSRELGKPAIIGTKIATKFLKNGEFIEMDMKKGQIKKLAQ
jgi:phosphohistidine swiveling domain-containing protein